jgi:hypothetical protein
VTLGEYADQLFRYATGWLGWTPEVTLGASIHHILLAMDGKVDFLRKTGPWGGGDDSDGAAAPKRPQAVADAKPDPAKATQQLMAFLRKRQQPQS